MKNDPKQMTPIMIARESNTIVVSITGQPELRKKSFSTTAKRPINSLKKGKKNEVHDINNDRKRDKYYF